MREERLCENDWYPTFIALSLNEHVECEGNLEKFILKYQGN